MSRPVETSAAAPVTAPLVSADGVSLDFDIEGQGPPLVLVHGSFSDHRSNWVLVRPYLASHFALYALARRGRGGTGATEHHGLLDEARDVECLIRAIGAPVFLLGHSYGAKVAFAAAGLCPSLVRKLILYEPPKASALPADSVSTLETLGASRDWEGFTETFFRDILQLPQDALAEMRTSDAWAALVADARASLGDIRALARSKLSSKQIRALTMPVLLQKGSESPQHLFETDLLAGKLANALIAVLEGQGHEGMTTAPELYARAVIDFLSGDRDRPPLQVRPRHVRPRLLPAR